jgi:DNA invertase Pin-like site-specific DNA recombinase
MDVGYARTSTKEQEIDNQIIALKEAGAEKIFTDEGVSGIIPPKQRKGFSELLEFIDKNQVDRLYLFELSRLGRSFLETLNLFMEFEKKGIRVISLSPSETWTQLEDKAMRELLLSIFAWVAEQERKHLIERTKAGLERAKAEGKKLGRPGRQIDWKKVKKYRDMGLSYSAISRLMDIPYSTLIKKKDKVETLHHS